MSHIHTTLRIVIMMLSANINLSALCKINTRLIERCITPYKLATVSDVWFYSQIVILNSVFRIIIHVCMSVFVCCVCVGEKANCMT